MAEKKDKKSTNKKITSTIRKHTLTPHLMDVGFFDDPSFDKWVSATRAANKEGSLVNKWASPAISDTIESLKVGYNSFMEDFEKRREKKYTGGKVGDKYYGGGPVYPRPTKGD